jgi:replicative DNA helicase
VLQRRGFTQLDMQRFGFAMDGDDLLFPLHDLNGVLVGIKRRLGSPDAKMRYVYEEEGYGAPPWVSHGYRDCEKTLLVEGELNAMIADSVLEDGSWGVVGVPGANSSPPKHLFMDRKVFIYADGDKPGVEAAASWAKLAVKHGAMRVTILPAREKDFCDIAGEEGRGALKEWLNNSISTAQPTYTIADKLIGNYTVRELRENAKRYINKDMALPTGFWEIDRYTGGLPDSGISLICALPSFGKSILLRDILLYLIQNKDKKVMLFSPDQSIPAIFRLIASKTSGIPLQQLRHRSFDPRLIEQHGSVQGIITHWGEVYDWAITELSKKLIISEAIEMSEMRKALTAGVEHYGVDVAAMDYIQIFEPESRNGGDGMAAKELKAIVSELKIPVLACTQLAKYKFDRATKRDGIPYIGDIEGSGRYYQAADFVMMIYNHELYWREYVDPENEPRKPMGYENDHKKVRIYIRKNKDGEFGDYRYLNWNASLVSFSDLIPKAFN